MATTGPGHCHETPDVPGVPHVRRCNLQSNSNLSSDFPCSENDDEVQEIPSLPEVCRYGINALANHLRPLVDQGLKSILLFGVVEKLQKDATGSAADHPENPVMKGLPILRKLFPSLILATDVCLCPYTDHGHCGVLKAGGAIDNLPSIDRIAAIAQAYAIQGTHVVAPSDMMDNRIAAIRRKLNENSISNATAILSYSCKFASSFYGPFRDAAKSAPAFGDRKCYQLPMGARGLALRAARRDVHEGANYLMVKPGMAYLDVLRSVKDEHPHVPLFVYQVSGEYAMLYNVGAAGSPDQQQQFQAQLMECLLAFRRSGADVIISYFVPLLLKRQLVK